MVAAVVAVVAETVSAVTMAVAAAVAVESARGHLQVSGRETKRRYFRGYPTAGEQGAAGVAFAAAQGHGSLVAARQYSGTDENIAAAAAR